MFLCHVVCFVVDIVIIIVGVAVFLWLWVQLLLLLLRLPSIIVVGGVVNFVIVDVVDDDSVNVIAVYL